MTTSTPLDMKRKKIVEQTSSETLETLPALLAEHEARRSGRTSTLSMHYITSESRAMETFCNDKLDLQFNPVLVPGLRLRSVCVWSRKSRTPLSRFDEKTTLKNGLLAEIPLLTAGNTSDS